MQNLQGNKFVRAEKEANSTFGTIRRKLVGLNRVNDTIDLQRLHKCIARP